MSDSTPAAAHILLVDDEAGLLEALSEFLMDQGYTVDAVEDPMDALDLLEEKVFDLVVTDYRMPKVDGIALLSRLKAANPQIEVIMITGYGSKESVLEALRLGVYDYIEKPFDAVELLKSIVNCLETVQLRTQVNRLMEDLHEHERELERAVDNQAEELAETEHCIGEMVGIAGSLKEIAEDVRRSSRKISKDLAECRSRRRGLQPEVTRLITTGALETREIRNRISDLEGLAQKIIEGVRDRQVGASGCPDRQIPEDRELELQVAARLERPSQDAEASPPVLDAPDPDTARAVDQIYADMQAFVADLIAAAGSEAPPRLEPALELMARIARLEGAVEVLYRRAIYSAGEPSAGDLASAVISHSANVAIYALKLGCGLRYDSDPLTTLGIAGLVHDVGMALMPPEIYTKDQLDEADMELLRTHPTAGHAYLLSGGDPWGHYAQIVLQEHEREDGSGYPNGIRGDQLLEEARIIGIVETYAGLTRTRPGRGGLMPFDAVREITQTQRKAFQRRILRALLQELSAFPIGSIVRLNSGTVARVIETDGAFPLRPVVQPLQDAKGRAVHGEQRLPLAQHPILHISGVVRMEEQTDRHTASGERR